MDPDVHGPACRHCHGLLIDGEMDRGICIPCEFKLTGPQAVKLMATKVPGQFFLDLRLGERMVASWLTGPFSATSSILNVE